MSSVRNWDELVAQGRELKIMEERIDAEHGNVRWQWGDLLLEVAPIGGHERNGASDAIRRYAEELDVSYSAMRDYRSVAGAWAVAERSATTAPWIVHRLFMGRDDREELIRNPVDVATGEKKDRWTHRMAQRMLGQKESPHGYRRPPQTTAEKLAEINGMVATIGDDEAVEFIDRVVDFLSALDERSPRPEPKPEPELGERWEKAIQQLDRVLTDLAKLNNETDAAGVTLSGHAAMARYLYERISEKKIEAEIRQFFEAEGLA